MSIRVRLLALAFALSASSVAVAQRVVVERFGGPQSARLRALLTQSLEENGLEVVPEVELREALRELELRAPHDAEQYVALARALRVAAFLDGRVGRARRTWTLRVTVRNGSDGAQLGASVWSGRNLAALRAVRRSGHARLQDHLSASTAPPQPIAVTTETVADPNAAPWYAAGEEEAPPGAVDETQDEPPTARDPRGYPSIRFALLGGTLRRSLVTDVLVDSAYRVPFEPGTRLQEQRLYESSGVGHMELGVSFELFPDAFARRPTIPWLGVMVHYRRSLLLNSEGPSCLPSQEPDPALVGDGSVPRGARCPNVDVVQVKTTQQELFAGLRLEPNVGDDVRGPWLTFDAGYGLFQFVLDPDDLVQLERTTIVPPLDYRYVHLGGGVRYGLHPTFFIGARFAYRVGLDVGADARRIWGAETGRPSGLQLGAEVRHEMIWLADGMFATLALEWFRFTTVFRGQTACAAGAECADYEPWEPWPEADGIVDGGLRDPVNDDYLRLVLQIGWAYR